MLKFNEKGCHKVFLGVLKAALQCLSIHNDNPNILRSQSNLCFFLLLRPLAWQ